MPLELAVNKWRGLCKRGETMTAESQFIPAEVDGRPAIALEIPGGILKLTLPVNTSPDRAEEVAEYLNLVIDEVTFKPQECMEPDLERLNEEQPVSVAVMHP